MPLDLPASFTSDRVIDQDVTIPVAHHAIVFDALKNLWDDELLRAPLDDSCGVMARAVIALLNEHGWDSDVSLVGNLVGLHHDVSTQPGQPLRVDRAAASAFYATIAPFVEDGCYIAYAHRGQRQEAWAIEFDGQQALVELTSPGSVPLSATESMAVSVAT